jgi:hypothetical protein
MKTKSLIIIIGAMLIAAMSCGERKTAPEGSEQKVWTYSMNQICKEWDGQWQGITVASDGCCYFGSSTHAKSRGAGFHKFDPKTYEVTVLSDDMTEVCGELDLPGHPQQGKIHSDIQEHNGWLYFCTHLSNYWKEGIENYPGAHIIGYEMATGKFRDYGIPMPGYSIYAAIGVDPKYNKIYAFMTPFKAEDKENGGCYLYSIDIESGEMQNLGMVVKGKGCAFYFYIDDNGNVWFTLKKRGYAKYENDHGNLYVYRPETGKIETYHDVLPMGQLIDGTRTTEKQDTQRSWTWLTHIEGRKKCLFIMGPFGGGDERAWIFDPTKNIESGEAFEPISSFGPSYFQTALAGDRLYFVQYENLEDERNLKAENARELTPADSNYVDYKMHLRSVSLKEGDDHNVITDHGPLVDKDGRKATMVYALAADENGLVYVYGSWTVKHPREASLQYQYRAYPNGDMYKLAPRGEFFAVVNTNLD